jgi:hypothetical protein
MEGSGALNDGTGAIGGVQPIGSLLGGNCEPIGLQIYKCMFVIIIYNFVERISHWWSGSSKVLKFGCLRLGSG